MKPELPVKTWTQLGRGGRIGRPKGETTVALCTRLSVHANKILHAESRRSKLSIRTILENYITKLEK